MKKYNYAHPATIAMTSPSALKPLVLALMFASAACAWAQVMPTNGNVVAGNASISSPGSNTINVNQVSNRAVIHWSDFSVAQGGTVNFLQPGANSITLNRVVGGRGFRSVIEGSINAPGRVFIINPSGVLFGATAQVNVGGLVASSLDLAGSTMEERNAVFMAGGEQFAFENDANLRLVVGVINLGSLTATGSGGRGGLIALIAPSVVNTGNIRADGGTVALGAGGRVTLDVGGDGLTKLVVGQSNDPVNTLVENRNGTITTNGGRIVLESAESGGQVSGVLVHEGSVLSANTMYGRNGEIILASGDGVAVSRSTLQARGETPGAPGGNIEMRGRSVEISSRQMTGVVGSTWPVPPVDSSGITPVVDVSGLAGGGSISTQSRPNEQYSNAGIVLVDETASLRADALGTGNGGNITLEAQNQLRVYGSMSARGGVNGGDGGQVLASAVMQGAGTQTSGHLDIAGARVDAGSTSGRAGTWQITGNGLTVVYGDTKGTLNSNNPASGANIQDNDINTALNNGTNVSVTAVANGADSGSVVLNGGMSIARTAQTSNPLALTISADGDIATSDGAIGIRSDAGPLAVAMTAGAQGGDRAIDLTGTIVTQGGALDLRAGTVALRGTRIVSGSGDVSVTGSNGSTYGVGMVSSRAGEVSSIETTTGNVTLRGRSQSSGGGVPSGVLLAGGSSITSTGGGTVEVTGSHTSNGAGVLIDAGQGNAVQSTGNVILRASNDGSTDALVIARGVSAGGMLNLRTGEVRADGTAGDVTQAPIVLGAASVGGFSVSSDELARLSAADMVVGSNRHAGTITVAGAVNTNAGLTLQSEGAGGSIVLNSPVSADRLGLLASGDIMQTDAAPVVANTLLARSSSGSVQLDRAANNVSNNMLGGGARREFRYQDVDALRLGVVSVTGASADTNRDQTMTSGRVEADTVFVRTLSQDLTLAADVSSRIGGDLVAGALLRNPANNRIDGAPWRVWAATWEGEARGGLSGSGNAPNLYGCSYGGPCGVTVTPSDNHFIYTQRPTVSISINDARRLRGEANPPLGYTATGLVNGDTEAALSGTVGTTASTSSPAGTYPITGSFTSVSGYRVNVVPGTLTVAYLPPMPPPDIVREEPNTYTFDSNLGNPPICFATSPLGGQRSQEGPDLLAMEWSRVRTRPSITSCINTERKNGCGDF